ncbi:MAG: hypothetical protein ACLQIQ_04790 [Beijerinckiaceae bacterium]
MDSAATKKLLEQPRQEEELDRQLEDTFPASDPPQMTRPDVHIGGPRRPEDADKAKRRSRRDRRSGVRL